MVDVGMEGAQPEIRTMKQFDSVAAFVGDFLDTHVRGDDYSAEYMKARGAYEDNHPLKGGIPDEVPGNERRELVDQQDETFWRSPEGAGLILDAVTGSEIDDPALTKMVSEFDQARNDAARSLNATIDPQERIEIQRQERSALHQLGQQLADTVPDLSPEMGATIIYGAAANKGLVRVERYEDYRERPTAQVASHSAVFDKVNT